MINPDLKREWKMHGITTILIFDHFELGFDKDGIGFGAGVDWHYKILYLEVFNLRFRFF